MWLLCGQNGPAAFTYLASALDTGPAATACGRQEDTVVAQRREQRASAVYLEGLFPVDYDGHFATGRKFGLRKQQQSDQQENDGQEEYNGQYNGRCHLYQISMPMKLMKAMPMSPVMMNVMPKPFKGAGTCE